MNRELAQTYISRALDGELPERQRAALEAWLAAHPEDRELSVQWQALGRLARQEASAVVVPDSDLAWIDIRRAIRTSAPDSSDALSFFFRWRLAWAAGTVAALCAAVLAFGLWRGQRLEVLAALQPAQIDWAETGVPGTSTMVYEDEESGLAVVWLMSDDSGDTKKNSG